MSVCIPATIRPSLLMNSNRKCHCSIQIARRRVFSYSEIQLMRYFRLVRIQCSIYRMEAVVSSLAFEYYIHLCQTAGSSCGEVIQIHDMAFR